MGEGSGIGAAVARQFEWAFGTLRDAIGHLDDQQWQGGDVDFLIPVRLAYHAVGAVDYYAADARDRAAINRLGGDWEASPPGELPSRAELVEYLGQVEGKMRGWLTGKDDAQLLASNTAFSWTGPTVLDQAIYALRHLQHHVAQINAELRRRGLPRGEWR